MSLSLSSSVFLTPTLPVSLFLVSLVLMCGPPVQLTSEKDKLKEAEKLLSESAGKVGDLLGKVLFLCALFAPP